MSSIERQISALRAMGRDLTGHCIVRIYTTTGKCRETMANSIETAKARVERNKEWAFFQFATIAVFNGVCWEEVTGF